MARRGVMWVVAAAIAVACSYRFEVPGGAQIACADGGSPCPDGWACEASIGRCVPSGTQPEVPEVRVSPPGALATSESGSAAALAVTLGASPTAPVRIPVASTKPAEARALTAELTFTAANWRQPQIITVQGISDSVKDGAQAFEVVLGPFASDDVRFSALQEIRIPGTNADVDTAEIVTNPTSVSTSEADGGGLVPVQVYLSSRPSAAVTVPVGSSDTGEAVVSPASITIQPADWNRPTNILVNGVDDPSPVADGTRGYAIQLGPATSADPQFQGVTASIPGQNVDNDSPGVQIDPTAGHQPWEASGASYFSVVLFTQPAADVFINLTSLNPGAVTVSPTTLGFDAGNWSEPQWVYASGVDNEYDELDRPWTIQTSATISADPGYSGLAVPDITGTTTDDDVPGFNFNPGGLSLDETGGPTQVTVTLQTRPRGQVTLQPTSTSPARVTVSPASLTFDGTNWGTGVPMTITPADDQVRGGDVSVGIIFAPAIATPQDPGYEGLTPYQLNVSLQDDERVIFTLATGVNGDMRNVWSYPHPDAICSAEGNPEPFNYSKALLVSNGPSFTRAASLTPNAGDGQYDWVLQYGKQYLSGTRDGPPIGRANDRHLLDFPLARALAADDAWTGLNGDWTTSANDCDNWTNSGPGVFGQAGRAGEVSVRAISYESVSCDSPRRLICVEQ